MTPSAPPEPADPAQHLLLVLRAIQAVIAAKAETPGPAGILLGLIGGFIAAHQKTITHPQEISTPTRPHLRTPISLRYHN